MEVEGYRNPDGACSAGLQTGKGYFARGTGGRLACRLGCKEYFGDRAGERLPGPQSTSVPRSGASRGPGGTGKNETGELSTEDRGRKQTGPVVGSCSGVLESYNGSDLFAPVCRPAARERSRTARTPKVTSDCSTLHPHARAAGPPTGRLLFLVPFVSG